MKEYRVIWMDKDACDHINTFESWELARDFFQLIQVLSSEAIPPHIDSRELQEWTEIGS